MEFWKTVARKPMTGVAAATSCRGRAAGIVVALVAVSLFSVLTPSARANAGAPAQIVSLGYSPSSVDVSSGPASVTFTAHLTDGSPITGAYVSLLNSAAGQQVNGQFQRVSGTAEDGVWQATLSVPQGAAAGSWDYTGTIQDALGSLGFGSQAWQNQSLPASAPGALTVTEGPQPPQIMSPADHSYQNSHSVVVSGTAEAGSTVSVLDGSSTVATVTADGSGNWSTTISGVSDGAHAYTATATDAAGNTSVASSAVHVTVDDVPPVTSITSGTTSAGDASFGFASSEADSTFECRLVGPNQPGAFTPCSSPIAYDNLANGSYTFTVRATDRAGNIDATPPSWTFIVQPQPAGGGVSTGGGPAAGGGTAAPVPPASPSAGSTGGGQSPVPTPPNAALAASRVGSLRLAPSTFAAAPSGPSVTVSRVSSGSTITFKLTANGQVYFRVQRSISGREVHGRCITGASTSHGARCTQLKSLAGSFRWNGHTGLNQFHFSGRLGGRKLKAGNYRLIAISRSGQSLSIPFRIIT